MNVESSSAPGRGQGAPSHPFLQNAAFPRIFGHRGFVSPEASGRGIVENTREAFEAAISAGASHVESDCRLTSDGRVVLFHDEDLTRVLDDPRLCAEVSFDELSRLLADRGGLMALDDALTTFPDTRFNIDIKTADAAVPAGKILGAHADRVLVTSFSEENRLTALRAATDVSVAGRPATSASKSGMVKVLIAVALRIRPLLKRAFADIDALQIPERQGPLRVLTPRLIAEAHRYGVEIHVWTVNDGEQMRALVDLGVDGIVTDRTDIAVGALRG